MRVLQLIDTLKPGGAERMAVSYANLLDKKGSSSFLCCTRAEGDLKSQVNRQVGYLYLEKKKTIDFKAFIKLQRFIVKNQIEIVHAHSSSFFIASILKISGMPFKLVWHDHYGNSELLSKRKSTILKLCSSTFNGIISVNQTLKDWALNNLKTKNVVFINNFVSVEEEIETSISLKGPINAFKIICLANLRPQKDHLNLLKAFEMVSEKLNSTLHLIGYSPKTSYSKDIESYILNSKIKAKIFYYGTQTDVMSYLKQANLGVLSSNSEGLPVALLEYGLAGLPVIVTDVGECKKVVNEYGLVIEPKNYIKLKDAIFYYFKNDKKRIEDAINFQKHILSKYGENSIYKQIFQFYKEL